MDSGKGEGFTWVGPAVGQRAAHVRSVSPPRFVPVPHARLFLRTLGGTLLESCALRARGRGLALRQAVGRAEPVQVAQHRVHRAQGRHGRGKTSVASDVEDNLVDLGPRDAMVQRDAQVVVQLVLAALRHEGRDHDEAAVAPAELRGRAQTVPSTMSVLLRGSVARLLASFLKNMRNGAYNEPRAPIVR